MRVSSLEDWIKNQAFLVEASQENLEKYQLKELKSTLTYAKDKSRFYKGVLSSTDINAIRTLSDFQKIPFTTSKDLSGNALDFLCVDQKAVKRVVSINTSGTGGKEKCIFFTEEDLEETVDFFQQGMSCLTDPTDRVLVLLPGKAYGSIGDLLKKALMKSKVDCIVYGLLNDLEEVERIIVNERITCLVGIPVQVLFFSRVKSKVFSEFIKKVLLSMDYVPDVLVKELYEKHGCKVYNHYGMTERGYGGVVFCLNK